ncbi:hypothetical protein [Pseudoduganella sp. UC29_71]|uniref:hypothetical protein n=1 Tax=Pseudoduganella sp. UC29_71 TaxID=3350174 RepID=UPI00366C0C48
MLDLSTQERGLLIRLGALIVDAEGEEVLAGLTVAESNFLVAQRSGPILAAEQAEHWLYQQILEAHLRARLALLSRRLDYLLAK